MAPLPVSTDVRDLFAREWLACTLRTYPAPAGGRLRDDRGPFRNPVGSTLRAALAGLTTELFGEFDRRRTAAHLDAVVRLRAVQDFRPDEVTAFVAFARQAAARAAEARPDEAGGMQLEVVHARIAELARMAEACLARCRDDLKAIGERAARRRVFVFERIDARSAARAAGCAGARPPAPQGGLP
jgi:hypothetical protein